METIEPIAETLATPGEQPPVLPKAPEYTRKQIGEMRRRFITVVHDTVSSCGHKFRKDAQPKNNCFDCWYAYFKLGVNMADIHQQLSIPKFGVMVVTREYGAKFVKMFRRFLAVELENLHTAAITEPNAITIDPMKPEDLPEGISPRSDDVEFSK